MVLTIREMECIHIVSDLLSEAVCDRQVLGLMGMLGQETVEMLVGSTVEFKDVLSGITHQEQFQRGYHIQ